VQSVQQSNSLSDLLERYSVSVSPVANNIYRSAVPAPKYLPERRSAAFRHHYSPAAAAAAAAAAADDDDDNNNNNILM